MKNLIQYCLLTAIVVLTGLQLNAQCDDSCIELSSAVEDYTVQCFEDLEAVSCDASITASTICNGEDLPISCVTAEQRVATTTCDATTAYGIGPDGALRLLGIDLVGLASEYFHPTDAGLTMVQYENGIAILTGQVVCDDDPTQIFDVHITFENRMDGADWGVTGGGDGDGGGFKHTETCTPDTDIWDIYTMKDDQSYMTGAGSLAGSYLTLMHAPSSLYFGFQIGEGANNHNCGYGAGGWFAWEGQINGSYAYGAMGDVIVDLDCSEQSNERCSASVDVVYTVLDTTCGILHTFTQTVTRLDDTPPTFDNLPADVTVDCASALPVVPTVIASDNCIDPGSPTVAYLGQFTTAYTAMSCRTLERRWSATDFCGNVTLGVQVISVVDNEDPIISLTIPADITLDVDANCDVDVSTAVTGDAIFTATDNCIMDAGSPVMTHIDAIVDYVSSGCYGIDRTFTLTAADSCGNSASESATQQITIQDLIAPVITLSAIEATIACDDWVCDLTYLEAAGYVSFSDNCEIESTEILSCTAYSGGCVTPVGTYEVQYEVIDACGNPATATQYIELTDEENPEVTIVCPVPYTLFLDESCNADLSLASTGTAAGSATDNCDDAPVVVITYEDAAPTYTCLNDDGALEGSHTILRTFTATATDHCENVSTTTCTQLITLLDEIDPEMVSITCPDEVTLYLDADCSVDSSTDETGYATAEASDNCDTEAAIDITFDDDVSDECVGGGSYTITRTFTGYATDDCGNNSEDISCGQTITVLDTISPIFDAYDIYVHVSCETIADPTDPTQVPISAQDNCDADVTYTIEAVFLSGGCPGTWMRTWTAHDNCGNTTTTEQYVEMYDLILPTVTCPADATVNLDADCSAATSIADLGTAELSDNCSSEELLTENLVVTETDQIMTCGDDAIDEGSYTFTRTFTTTDYCDNVNACTQLITVLDEIAPMASLTDEIVACHDYNPATEYTTITSSDNCDSDIAYTWSNGDAYDVECIGTYKVDRTYIFVDDCENATTVVQTVQVLDDEAPVATGDTETTIACHEYSADDSDDANLLISLSDNCGSITWSFTDVIFSGGCVQPAGMYERTYTFSDDCGNTDTFIQYITLVDNVNPTFVETLPADVTEECDNVTTAASMSGEDNCDGDVEIDFTETFNGLDDDCSNEYTITRTWVATDDCDNSISHTQTVTVIDTTAPVFTAFPADATEECDAIPAVADLASLSADDNCDDSPSIVYIGEVRTDGVCPDTYTLSRTWETEDCAGNAYQRTQTIEIQDTTAPAAPTISCPADATLTLDAACSVDSSTGVTGEATATTTDNCDDAPSMVITHEDSAPVYTCDASDGEANGSYSFLREFTATATDTCGNVSGSSSCSQTIFVNDEIAPVFDASIEFSIACDEYSDLVQYEVAASDNCDTDVTITILSNNEVSGSCAGSVLRVYEATDDCGNSTTFEQVINLIDTVNPVVTIDTCPLDVTLNADEFCYANTSTGAQGMATASAVDNCDDDTDVVVTYADSDTVAVCEGSYSFTRTFTATATDHCENTHTASCSQLITVQDVTPPIMVDASDATVECDGAGNSAELSAWLANNGGATATDNCSGISWSNDFTALSDGCGATGSATVTFTATDDCSNSSSTMATFTIEDTTDPVITADATTEVACDAFDMDALYAISANDDCGSTSIVITSQSEVSGSCAGSYYRLYTVTDDCDNESVFNQTINLIDAVAPVVTIDSCPADVTLNADEFCYANTSTGAQGMATASAVDNCDDDSDVVVTYADSDTVAVCEGSYSFTRTFTATATDHCENTHTASCTQLIAVQDVTPPFLLSAATDLTVECDGSGNAAELAVFLNTQGGASAFDNCVDVIWSNDFTALSDDCDANGAATVIFTAADDCGNSSTTTATFTIEDTTDPVFAETLPAAFVTESCEAVTPAATLTATDNCGDVSVSYTESNTAGACAQSYTITRTWSTSDCSGNDISHTQVLTVVDDTPPVLTVLYGGVAAADADVDCADELLGFSSSATDNCGTPTITHVIDTISSDACGNSVVDHVFTATDECTNETTQTFTLTVQDGIAPQFTETCGLSNDESIDICCESHLGEVTIPDACETEATDNCSDVDIDYTETPVGEFAPTDDVTLFCTTSTPAAHEDGETCNGFTPHSLHLFNFPTEELFSAADAGLVEHLVNGDMHITQTLQGLEDPTSGFTMDVTYENGLDFDAWISQSFPTNYKRDCGDLTDDHENWMYYVMSSGTMTGFGDLAGVSLNLSHQPANHYFGFQVGVAANNMNNNYGYSGWLMWSGTVDGVEMVGSGDIFGDLDCCLPYELERTYVASDCTGNETEFSYTLNITGEECEDAGSGVSGGAGTGNHNAVVIGGAGNTNKIPISVTNLSPNPTSDYSQLGFMVINDMRVRVDMTTMDGVLVTELFNGLATGDAVHMLDINADQLQSGMYQIRLSSNQYMVVKKLLVTN